MIKDVGLAADASLEAAPWISHALHLREYHRVCRLRRRALELALSPPSGYAVGEPAGQAVGFMIALVPVTGLKRERGKGGLLLKPRLSLQL